MSQKITFKINDNSKACMTEQCTICLKVFELTQNEQPHVIQIQNNYYCQLCLQRRLLQQEQVIRGLQQRYIYYKQYQSSFNTKQYCQKWSKQKAQHDCHIEQLQLLQAEYKQVQKKLLQTKQQCILLKQKVLSVQTQQSHFWQSINRFQKRALRLEKKSLSCKLQSSTIKSDLENLTHSSLYHDVFQITIKDGIGYVSGMAMGKKPETDMVNWEDFNVGLGHLFIGFNILKMKYQYEWVKFRKLELKGNLTKLALYGSKTLYYIAYTKQNQKPFGEILEALLLQIQHFIRHITQALNLQYNADVKLPYPIQSKQNKIANIFINPTKLDQKLKWSKWSQAMKYLLINFKHLITIHAIYGKDRGQIFNKQYNKTLESQQQKINDIYIF